MDAMNETTTKTDGTTTRSRRGGRVRARLLAGGMAAVIGVSSLAMTPHALAEGLSSQGGAETMAPPGGVTATWSPVDAIATGILSKIAGDGTELLMKQIGMGDQTSAKLDKITAQLAEMQQHLDQMWTQLQSAIAYNHYSSYVHQTDHTRTQIENTFREYRDVSAQAVVVINARAAVDAAKTPEEKASARARLTDAQKVLDQRIEDFKQSYRDEHISDALGDLNKLMDPAVGADGVVGAYRKVVLSDSQYLTEEHSKSVRTVYGYFENYQAIAALLNAEYNAATGRDNTELAARFSGYIETQRKQLPTMIPAGFTIDVGPHAESTKNKTMWFDGYAGTFTGQPGDKSAGGVEAFLSQINSSSDLGFTGWRLPTGAEYASLFNRFTAGSTAAYVNGIGLTHVREGDIAWQSDISTQDSPVYRMGEVVRTVHTATRSAVTFGPTSLPRASFPKIPGSFEQNQDPSSIIPAAFANAKASAFVVRSTGDTVFM